MHLLEFCDHYIAQRDLTDKSAYQLMLAAREFHHWSPVPIAQLTDHRVNLWLAHLLETDRSRRSVKNFRASILTLWRAAFRQELAPAEPKWVKPIKVPATCPVAWTREELARLIAAAAELPGYLSNDLPRPLYFRGLILAAYDTGLRKGDLLALRLQDGPICLTQSKTGQVHSVALRAETRQVLREIQSITKSETPLEFPGCDRTLYNWMQRLCRLASVPYAALQQVRRTGATQLAIAGQQPTRYLGHRSPDLAERSYVDRRQTDKPVLPRRVS